MSADTALMAAGVACGLGESEIVAACFQYHSLYGDNFRTKLLADLAVRAAAPGGILR